MNKNKAISEILNKFAEFEPNASKELTQNIPKIFRGTEESKLIKISIIRKKYPDIFKKICSIILPNDPETINALGYSSNSIFNSNLELNSNERLPGSFGLRYEASDKMID